MLSNRVRVVVPVYKKEISTEENISLASTKEKLSKYGITFLTPEGLDIVEFLEMMPGAKECRMKQDFFDGFSGYNRLMLSKELYQEFCDYEYVLICQQDVLALADRLETFLDMPYDYIGAPIPHMGPWSPKLYTGNGGFSLRRVSAVLKLLNKHREEAENITDNEDIFFSNAGEKYPEEFKTAPIHVSSDFASNMYHEKLYRLNNNRLPMAVHGFCTGDVEFLKEKVLCRSPKFQHLDQQLLLGWEDDWRRFLKFVREAGKIVLYGAGDAAKVFRKNIEILGKDVEAYIVSDEQKVPTTVDGIPAYHLSEYPDDYEKASVLIAISTKYKILPDFETKLREKGVRRIFHMSNELWHKGINELIEV